MFFVTFDIFLASKVRSNSFGTIYSLKYTRQSWGSTRPLSISVFIFSETSPTVNKFDRACRLNTILRLEKAKSDEFESTELQRGRIRTPKTSSTNALSCFIEMSAWSWGWSNEVAMTGFNRYSSSCRLRIHRARSISGDPELFLINWSLNRRYLFIYLFIFCTAPPLRCFSPTWT